MDRTKIQVEMDSVAMIKIVTVPKISGGIVEDLKKRKLFNL
jgi:hypothetical protein